MKPSVVMIALAAVLLAATQDASASGPRVIIVGAGMSGTSTGRRLWESGVQELLFLEATDRVGGRMHKHNFGGRNVEIGANWVEGVGGKKVNPILPIVNDALKLRNFYSDFDSVVANVYKENGGLYDKDYVENRMDRADEVQQLGANLSKKMDPSGRDDISILAMQRLFNHQPNGPSTPVDMALDYYKFDYAFAEPPRVTSLQNTEPTPTNADFGEDSYFVADQRGFESIIHYIGSYYLSTDADGRISDRRVLLNKVVRQIAYNNRSVVVKTEDGSSYAADFIVVSTSRASCRATSYSSSPSCQSVPFWKIFSIYRFDMAVYTKIFLKFPRRFWPVGDGKQFFVYASQRRGYYGMWQSFEQEYPGAHVLLVTVTDDESRRIEQQPDNITRTEAVAVLRNMFPDVDATDIYVPRWWSNRFFKGSYSNWPIGVNRYEYDQLRAPVGRVYFTGEHTSKRYNGYLHGAYLAGIDSADILINRIVKNEEYKVRGNYEDQAAEA